MNGNNRMDVTAHKPYNYHAVTAWFSPYGSNMAYTARHPCGRCMVSVRAIHIPYMNRMDTACQCYLGQYNNSTSSSILKCQRGNIPNFWHNDIYTLHHPTSHFDMWQAATHLCCHPDVKTLPSCGVNIIIACVREY